MKRCRIRVSSMFAEAIASCKRLRTGRMKCRMRTCGLKRNCLWNIGCAITLAKKCGSYIVMIVGTMEPKRVQSKNSTLQKQKQSGGKVYTPEQLSALRKVKQKSQFESLPEATRVLLQFLPLRFESDKITICESLLARFDALRGVGMARIKRSTFTRRLKKIGNHELARPIYRKVDVIEIFPS
jgi:hypothetical protein